MRRCGVIAECAHLQAAWHGRRPDDSHHAARRYQRRHTASFNADGSIDTMTMAAVPPLADSGFAYQDLLFRPAPAGAPR